MPSTPEARQARRLANLDEERRKDRERQRTYRALNQDVLDRPKSERDGDSVVAKVGRRRDLGHWPVYLESITQRAPGHDDLPAPSDGRRHVEAWERRFSRRLDPADLWAWEDYFRLNARTTERGWSRRARKRAREVARLLMNEPWPVREMARRIRARPWQSGIELYGVQTKEQAEAVLGRLNELGLLHAIPSERRPERVGYEIV